MLNLDTHVLLYALAGDLKKSERELLESDVWSISAIVIWEVAKLAQLDRIEMDLNDPELVLILERMRVWPITVEICREIGSLDFQGDPADELIAATSLVHSVPLVTRDRTIRRSKRVPLAD